MSQEEVQGCLTAHARSHAKGSFRGGVGPEPIVHQGLDGVGNKIRVGLGKGEIHVSVFEMPPSHARKPIALGTGQQDDDGKFFAAAGTASGV